MALYSLPGRTAGTDEDPLRESGLAGLDSLTKIITIQTARLSDKFKDFSLSVDLFKQGVDLERRIDEVGLCHDWQYAYLL